MMSNSEVVPIRNTPFNTSRKKEWKKLTRFQKNWILEKAYRLYVSFLTDKHWFPHCSERRYLIEVLYAQICDRGIMIPKGEVRRIVDYKMRKWNRKYLERELGKKQTMLQDNNVAAK